MSILVTGSTGTIGTQVLGSLQGRGVEVRALTRSPDTAKLPPDVTPVGGDLADVETVRAALHGVSTLFLLVPNVADELTQAMLALSAAREAGVRGIVYLSVLRGEAYADVPHFAAKYTVERMIEVLDLSGVYGMPIGAKGVSMVDIRDVGEVAAKELVRRERSASPLPREIYTLAGPDALTGKGIASIWSEALGRAVLYGGDELVAMEQRLRSTLPAWHALDLRLMLSRYQTDGAVATADELARLTALLGHAPRSYRDFARDAAAQWANG